MPTPLQILLDPISLTLLALYAGLMLWEARFPGRELAHTPGWKMRGLACFAVFFFLSSYLPLIWDRHLAAYQLFDLTGFGTLAGVALGLVAYELVAYAYHRSMHGPRLLWRAFHQMHHSAERLDTFGVFYFSPLDMVGWTAVSSFALVLVVGVSPPAATILLLTITFLGMFQHANIRTPRWLGYLVQRPESHTVHHAKGIHYYNFADLPVIDMLFGTFRNPKTYERETGFYQGASRRIGDMLLFRDVTRPAVKPDSNDEPSLESS